MAECSTSHGTYRCDRDEGHCDERGIPTECETEHGPRPLTVRVDLDARRELSRAAKRLSFIEEQLAALATPCTCSCCMRVREVMATLMRGAS